MKIIRTGCVFLGILCFLLNSLVYIFPSEVAIPPVKVFDMLLFYSALHSLFVLGIILITIAYLINKKIKNDLLKDEMNLMIDEITSLT